MIRRYKRWTASGLLLAAAVGCNRNELQPPNPLASAAKKENPSLIQQAFGHKPQFNPTPPAPEPVVVREASKPGQPLKPETELALADNEIEAAFMPNRSPTDRDQFLDTARQRLQRVLAEDPKNKTALSSLTKLYSRAGNYDKAVATLQTAIQQNPNDHDLIFRLAGIQVQYGDWAAGAATCRQALAADPENRTYNKALGFCLAHQGQWQEAGETMIKAMPHAEAHYFLARIRMDRGDLVGGRQQMQMALQANPDFALAKQALADLDAGKLPATGGVHTAAFSETAK